jgi:hypothetical protein
MSEREKPGLGRATKLVADRASAVGRLTAELAIAEVKRKVASLGAGLALVVCAVAFVLLAVAFALAAAAAALALVLATWLAILVIAGALLLAALLLGGVGVVLLRRGSPPVPEHAIDETRRTLEVLKDGR